MTIPWEHRLVCDKDGRLYFASVVLDDDRVHLATVPVHYGHNVEDMRILAQKLLAACDRKVIDIDDRELKYAIGI